jgi:hypothetical protein
MCFGDVSEPACCEVAGQAKIALSPKAKLTVPFDCATLTLGVHQLNGYCAACTYWCCEISNVAIGAIKQVGRSTTARCGVSYMKTLVAKVHR